MAKKDLIIGGASGYTWDQLKYWVSSIKDTGFKGDIVLCVSDMTQETQDKLHNEGVILCVYGDNTTRLPPHVIRFFQIWNYLETNPDTYANVVVTDTRDVIFQKDPSQWLYENLPWNKGRELVTSSEGLRYKNEPWGDKNLMDAMGPYFHKMFRENMIYNVGTIGGHYHEVKDLLLVLFQMCVNRPVAICDQAMFNFLIQQEPYKSIIRPTDNSDTWAIQLGTTAPAVSAGSGDLGKSDLTHYLTVYEDHQPTFHGEKVMNNQGYPYAIVHQWDRVPSLKTMIEEKYSNV